jgi:hypothetical protein
MGVSAGAMWLSDMVYRLGVEHHLGELHKDQVSDDERAQHGKELPRQRREAEDVSQRRSSTAR